MLLFRREKPKEETWKIPGGDFLQWTAEYLWLALPLVKRNDEAQPWKEVLSSSISSLLWSISKVAISPVVHELMVAACPTSASIPKPVAWLSLMWMINVPLSTATQDVQDAVVTLTTRGRYGVLSFHNLPFLSSSISEFWSRRYNNIMRTFLHDTVFTPARSCGISPTISAMITFAVSGLLHSYVAYFTFGRGAISSFLFFMIHGAACVVDRLAAHKYGTPRWLRAAFVPLLLVATQPLYPALFIDAMPEWLNTTTPEVWDFLKPLSSWTSELVKGTLTAIGMPWSDPSRLF
jgi:hypothetical protein